MKFHSYNPSNKDEVIASFSKGTVDLVNLAVETAYNKFQEWQYVPAEKRARILFKAASIVRNRRFEINAWMILEAGKNYTEADADTAEAIDFLEFYAREILRYSAKQPITPVKGEKNELPRGRRMRLLGLEIGGSFIRDHSTPTPLDG